MSNGLYSKAKPETLLDNPTSSEEIDYLVSNAFEEIDYIVSKAFEEIDAELHKVMQVGQGIVLHCLNS